MFNKEFNLFQGKGRMDKQKKRKRKRLSPDLYYFCMRGKNPNMGKIRNYCHKKRCPSLGAKPRLIKIERDRFLRDSKPPLEEGGFLFFLKKETPRRLQTPRSLLAV